MCCCVVMRQVWWRWIVLLLLLLLETGESIRTHGNNTDVPVSQGTDSEEGFWRWSTGQWRRSVDVDVVDVESRGSWAGNRRGEGWTGKRKRGGGWAGKRRGGGWAGNRREGGNRRGGGWAGKRKRGEGWTGKVKREGEWAGKRRRGGGWVTLSTRLWNMITKTRQNTDRVALCGGRYSVSEGRSYTFTLTDNATCSMIFTTKRKASLKLVCSEPVVEESCLHLATRKKTYTYCGEGKATKVSLNAMTELLVVYRLYHTSHDTTTTTTTTRTSQDTNQRDTNIQDTNTTQDTKILDTNIQDTTNSSQNTTNPSQDFDNPSQNTNNPSSQNTNNPSSQNINNPSQDTNRALQNTRILQCRVVGRKGNRVYRAKGPQACPLSCGATNPDAGVNLAYFPSAPMTPTRHHHSAGHVDTSGQTKEGLVTRGRERNDTTIHKKQPQHQFGPVTASNDSTIINKKTQGHLKTIKDDSEGRDEREMREEPKVNTERRNYRETGEEQTVNKESKDEREAREKQQEVNTELMTLLDNLTESNEAKMKTTPTTTTTTIRKQNNPSSSSSSSAVMRIKGGQEAGVGEWPWMVYLKIRMHNTVLSCGGSILTASFVLTAAHCVYDVEQDMGHWIRAVAYEHNLKDKHETPRQVVLVHTIFLHPTFNIDTLEGDIALLSLKKPLVLGVGVATVCLAPPGDYEGREVVVLGWGAFSINGADAKVLQEGSVKVVNQKECVSNYSTLSHNNHPVTPLHVCNAEPGVDSCVGDSGGPLVLRQGATWYQLGIVSFGKGCAKEGFPGVNTLVPSYTRWILSTINKYHSTTTTTTTTRDTNKAEECYHESSRRG